MKRILFILAFLAPALMFGQKIRDLTTSTSAASSDLIIMAENGEDTLKHITKANFLNDYVAVSDTATMLTVYIARSDTAAILSPYILESEVDGVYLALSDTASMLANYALLSEITGDLSASDTASMLLPYIRESEVLAYDYVASSDTATMLTPYIERSDTSSMLTNYILSSEVSSTYEPLLTNSAGLASALSDETGTGVAVFGTSPTFTTGITIGTATISETEAGYVDGVTSDIQTQIDLKADIANESHTGNTSIADLTAAKLNVGVAGGDMVELDSIIKDASNDLWFFDGTDTLGLGFTSTGTESLSDYAVMLADSGVYDGGYVTPTDLDDAIGGVGADSSWTSINFIPISTAPSTNEGDLYYDSDDDSLYLRVNTSWVALNREAGSGSMTYPDAGIALSDAGTSWGTSITNSSGMAGAISDETGTGVMVFGTSPTFTTGITIGTATIDETEASYLDGVTSDVQTQLDDTVSIETLTPLLTDDLYPVKQFKTGTGIPLDTTRFETTYDLGHGWYKIKEDSLEITQIEYYISSGDTIEFDVVYGSTLGSSDGTIVSVEAEDGAMTSIASFTTSTIPEGNYIWIDVTGVTAGRRPNLFGVDLYGYIKRD